MINIKNNYKIKKNYLKYLVYSDLKYIENICKILNTKNILKGGGKNNNNIDFVINNINLITNNIELFNRTINIINIHDDKMSIINPKYEKYDYKINILDYIDKINKQEFNFV